MMGIKSRRRVIIRVLILLLIGCVCYSLFVGLHAVKDIEKSANVSTFMDLSKAQRHTPLPQPINKQRIVSFKLPLDIKMTSLKGQDALRDYCNSPKEKTTGNEGAQIEGYNLRLVHVFTRHGDRTSIHHLSGYKPEIYNCKFSTWYTGSDEKIRAFPHRMDAMSKTMLKTSFRKWSIFPNEDVCIDSELTSRGALQHIRLGQHLYDTYINHFHLFKAHKSLSSQVGIKSTGTSRTFQSATAFLYGFVPQFNISDFNIGLSHDLHFCSVDSSKQVTCNCPNHRNLHIRASWFQSANNKNSTYFKKLRDSVSDVFKLDNSNSRWLTGAVDAIVPAYCHNLKIPCSSINPLKCISHSLLGKLWDAVTDREFSTWDDPDFNFLKYSSIKMSSVLLEILQRMKDLIEGKDIKIFNVYSGHDVTVSPLLFVLGLHDGRWPPYASRVVIETYEEENDEIADRFYLKVLYNGVDQTEHVIFCKNRTVNGLCNFKHFNEFVSNELLQRFGYSNPNDACN